MTHCATRTSNFICATWSQLLFLKATIRDNHGNTAHILITSLSSNKTPFSENGNDKTGLCCILSTMVVDDLKKKKKSNSQLWFQTSDGFCIGCIHPMSAAILKSIFAHLCKPQSAYRRKIPFRVCKQRHCLQTRSYVLM